VTNIFIGNLDSSVTEEQLRAAFGPYGQVETVMIVLDRDTGQPRGFAFVEMPHAQEAANAIRSLDGMLMNKRPLRVNEARPKSGHDEAYRGRDHRRHRI
jgi:RNA recognition motif-containing protein